jgi:hypothetical protein
MIGLVLGTVHMLAAVTLVFALPVLAAAAEPQHGVSALGAPVPRESPAEVKGSGVIRGRVTSLGTGKPLRRAQLRLSAENDYLGTPRTASTSNDGRYELRDVPPGRYTLRVQRSGYLTLTYGQRRPGEQPRLLELGDEESIEKVDFALPRMGVISGRVLDELGEPFAGVTVAALQARYVDGRRRLVPIGAQARTDTTGEYRLLSLAPGDYVVMGSTHETWPLDTDPRQVFGYAPSYFPGTSVSAMAQRVKLGVGEETANVDFTLVPGRTSTLRGTATGAGGLPLAGETVTALQEVSGLVSSAGSLPISTRVAGDGTWTLTNIVPGEYRLSIRTPPRTNQPALHAQLTVTVAGVDLDGLSLIARTGATVRGLVVTDDGSALPVGYDRMQVRPPFNPGTRMMTSLPTPENGRVRSDGSFEVQDAPGNTLLSIAPLPGDWTLKAIEVDGRDLTDQPLPVEHGATLSGVRIVLTSRPTTIRGVLRDARRNPAEGTVIVFAEDSAKWREGSHAIRVPRPDQRGLFSFRGLPAGEYRVIALDYVQEGHWHDPEFLESVRARAERIAVADAESKQIDLVVKK